MDAKQLVLSIFETVIKIIVAVFIIIFVYDAAIKAYDYGYRVFAEEPVSAGEGRIISIYVKEEDSVKDIGNMLQEKGLIRDANLFVIQELLSENHGKIQPGIYDLNTSMSAEEMLTVMAADKEDTDENVDTDVEENIDEDADTAQVTDTDMEAKTENDN